MKKKIQVFDDGDTDRHSQKFELERIGSWALIWHLVRRHQFGLVVTWAAIITLCYFVPFLPGLLFGLLSNN